jgi:DinB superfamily
MIQGFDQEAYARQLRYDSRPIEAALRMIEAARATTLELLAGIAEAEWQRAGIHAERGRYTVERWLELNASHAHEHAEQIRRIRTASASR